jgi:hypothetical protein
MIKTTPFPTTFLQGYPGLWGPRIQVVSGQTFTVDELQKRVLMTTKDKKKGKPAFYVDPRTLDHRLNLCFGGAWNIYFKMDQTGDIMIAHATLIINGIVREDISSEIWKKGANKADNMSTTKASAAAYKRAAVKFGITSYMYEFKNEIIWYPIDPNYDKAFKDPNIKLSDLPAFARPVPGPQFVLDELIYLCDTDDPEVLKKTLSKYWGLDSVKDLDRDDCFRLAACIARVSDFLELSGKTIEQLADEKAKGVAGDKAMGFNIPGRRA